MRVINQAKADDGSFLIGIQATEKEIGILVNIALSVLIELGEVGEDEFDKPSFEIDLDSIPIEQFYKA